MKTTLILSLLILIGIVTYGQTRVTLKLPNNCNNVTDVKDLEIEKGFDFKVYPNPANDFVNIEVLSLEIIGKAQIEVFSIDSRKVYSEQIYCNSPKLIRKLNLTGVKSNSYFVRISSSRYQSTKPLVIQQK